MSDTIPADIAAVLDPQLSQKLIEEVTVGQSAYYIIEQVGEEEGGLVVVRQTPGSKPEVIAADSSLVTPDGGPLPREVIEALEPIFGKPEVETGELQPSLVEPSERLAPSAAREDVSERLFKKAQELNGHLSSRDVPGTDDGNLACAWAVNEVAREALGRPIGGNLSVLNMRKVLVDRYTGVSEANASEGMIIISCSQGSFQGHVGIVGEKSSGDRKVYSNSSSRALWMQNYTIGKWRADFHGNKALPVEFFKLESRHSPRDGHPPYPGTPLQEGSRGEDVRTVQERLNSLGSKLERDGIFGPKTRQAVVPFQEKVHLTADGVVGPNTWAALWSAH